MKNKLLLTLLEMYFHSLRLAEIYRKSNDETGQSIYENAKAEHSAYGFIMYKTYGYTKTEKLIAEYKAMRDAKNN